MAAAVVGDGAEEVEQGPAVADGGAERELGVEVGEGEGVGVAAGEGELALDGLRHGGLVGGDGGGHAAGE